MGDPVVEFEFEKHVAALVASSTQALPSQLGISTGEDVARLRRDPSIQAALKKCDDTVDRLRRMQVQLEQAAAEINRQAAAIRSALEPVMSLPPEILSEIFKLIVHTPLCIDEEPDRVLRIAAVCRKWRYTALATRNLWALFDTSRTQAQQVAWLARSSPGPIDVLVKGQDWVAAPLPVTLCHEAFRWRSIMLLDVKSTVDYLDTLMKLPNLRNLQTINLALPGWYYPTDEVERDARDFQSTLPRLKSISIGYIAISNMSTIAENLTNLSLSNVAYPSVEWWKLLRSCQNLDILKLDNNEVLSSGSDRPDSALENIVLPRLQDLTISSDLDGLGDMIFDHVSAPALHSLDVCHYCRLDPSEPCLCMSLRPFVSSVFLSLHKTVSILYLPYHSLSVTTPSLP